MRALIHHLAMVLLLCSLWPHAVAAQQPTPAQLEQLRQLTPEQRRQLARYLVPDGNTGSSAPRPATEPAVVENSELADEDDEEKIEVIQPGNSLVIDMVPPPDTEPMLEGLREATGRSLYTVGDDGHIVFPSIGPVLLAGLTQEQATLRLTSEPLLKGYSVTVYLLPVDPTGRSALEPFG
ncbi:MAG: polysaccharide biosynthesis/export family protein, partial [Pseudomonadota bacterium]